MIEPEISTIKPQPADKKKIFKIWWVAGILALVTAAEFYVALQFPESWKGFKIFLFIGMTFIKAGYIVMEFMHLGHEQKSLMWTILIPTAFVVWLLGALFIQADAIYQAKRKAYHDMFAKWKSGESVSRRELKKLSSEARQAADSFMTIMRLNRPETLMKHVQELFDLPKMTDEERYEFTQMIKKGADVPAREFISIKADEKEKSKIISKVRKRYVKLINKNLRKR